MDNKLNNINLTAKEIERKLKKCKLEFLKAKRNDTENRFKFPLFVKEFYKYIDQEGELPKQKEFYDFYIQNNLNNDNIKKLSKEQLNGLKARIYRGYPSWIRDLHFAKLLEEKANLDKIIYNIKLDTKDGIDVLVKENKNYYAISLFVDTKRSQKARIKKEHTHEKLNEYFYIDLPLNFNTAREVGDFYLYSSREMVKLFNLILETQKAG